ncbi:MAG: endolytic transglycosylase MltG [Thermoleophilales bacterium]|nr:endolytic transglycosylase MltG [Thermoleophilales bacterium]
MSPDESNFEDPFAEGDAARERARRRAEREAKRKQRDNRASLAERVSGAIDDATSRGREKIEQTRERARSPEPPSDGVEPPSFRRAPAAPAPEAGSPAPAADPPRRAAEVPPRTAASASAPPADASQAEPEPASEPPASATRAQRLSAEEAMPRRESMFRPRPTAPAVPPAFDTSEGDAVAPEPLNVPDSRRPAGESEEWAAMPAAEGSGSGGTRRPRPSTTSSGWTLWRRRLLAIGAVVLLVAGAAFAVDRVRGGDDTPAPAPVKNVKTTDVTIPEGLTSGEIADVAKKAGLKGDYAKAMKQAQKKFDVQKLGGPKDATLEGFLFPATYEVEKGAPVSNLVDKQLYEGFEPNFAQVNMSKAKKAGFSEFDVVTIASMIEREVQVPEEAKKVAAVIYNRIDAGMPLGIDATVRYAIGNNYSKALEPSDLEIDSPYNTYKYPGLPVGPISNPGLNSLQAAADPDNDDYLYYVVKPNTCPAKHFFTDSYDEFLAASDEYDAAQAAAGGKPNC